MASGAETTVAVESDVSPLPLSPDSIKAVLDAMPDPVCVLHAVRADDGSVVDFQYDLANAATLRRLGLSADDVIGRTQFDLYPSARDTDLLAKLVAVVESGKGSRIELPSFDESILRDSFELNAAPFGDGVVITARDVTDRDLTAEQLRRERDFNNAVLDVAASLIVVLDDQWRIVRFNHEAEILSGYAEDEVLGRDCRMLLPPDEQTIVLENLAPVATGQPVGQINHWVTKDGSLRLIRWTNAALVDESADRTHVIAIGIDITEQNEAIAQLRHERDFNNAVLDVAASLIMVMDADWRIVRFNHAAETLSGYTEAEVLGRHYGFLIPRDEQAVVHSNVERVSAANPVGQVNNWITKDGRLRLLRWTNAGLVDADGNRTHTIAIGTDITEQHEAELELARRATELEAANRDLARSNADLEQFAYIASHDLGEPLRAISGPLRFIADRYRGQLDPKADEFIEYAVDGCARMQSLIDGLLTFSRVGRVEATVQRCDADLAARDALALLASIVQATKAQVTIEPLPVVLAEPQQLSQVFQNLIGNALKFVAPDVAPLIAVSSERRGALWRFSVVDNGIGIPERHRERIFTMFKRLHPPEEFAGTGIGLAIVKKIVERHGGEIGVADGPGGTGSEFWFTLPATD